MHFDSNLNLISEKSISIIGYGNQGRAQALNLRDNGLNVIIGNIRDEYWERAERDGFKVYPIGDAVKLSEVTLMLIPDEVAPQVFKEEVEGNLRHGHVLCFASGYNVAFGYIKPPTYVDVVLVAPRMIGEGVRSLFLEGKGFPVLIGVHQDYSGRALDHALAIAKGIGSLNPGGVAIESSFWEEAVTDLFGEQVVGGGMLHLIRAAFEVMIEFGINPMVAILELYASGELIELAKAIYKYGLWDQLNLHSSTSQYGQQTRGPKIISEVVKATLRSVMEDIVSGKFAEEWMLEQRTAKKNFEKIWRENLSHEIVKVEKELYKLLRRLIQ